MRCDICNNETKLKKVKKYKYSGVNLSNVYLDNIEVRICENCDLTSPLIPKIIRLHNTIARAIICKTSLLLGEEVRFLRKNLRLKAQDWAKYLRKDIATISRAEKDENILNKDLDLLIRLAYLRLWEEKNEDFFNEKIAKSLTVIENNHHNILIDVDKIEEFSYFEDDEVWDDIVFLPETRFEKTNTSKVKATYEKGEVKISNISPYLKKLYARNKKFAIAS
jgi:transcriptional regulator with XRE-family HTH domain